MNRLLCMLLLLAGSTSPAWAVRVLEQPEGAYELSLNDVTLPGSTAGSIIFQPCPDCTTVSLRVSLDTRYQINGAPLALEDFLRAVDRLAGSAADANAPMLTVYYDRESRRVTRVALLR
jgi:hypothetical protein